MSDLLNIVYIQPDIKWHDINGNLKQYDNLISPINNADIIVMPEMFATGFTNQIEGLAQPMNGKIVSWMQEKSMQKNSAIIGSQIITDENGDNHNRLIMALPDGKIEWYDKRHLFRMGCENDTLTAGHEIKIFEFRGWHIRPIVCYDLRFPVWNRNKDNHYDLLICVAAWPTARHNIFEILLRARAIENQCYVVGVNRVGTDGLNINYAGGSTVIDIYGNIISQLPENTIGCGQTTISLEKLNHYREKFPTTLDADDFSIEI